MNSLVRATKVSLRKSGIKVNHFVDRSNLLPRGSSFFYFKLFSNDVQSKQPRNTDHRTTNHNIMQQQVSSHFSSLTSGALSTTWYDANHRMQSFQPLAQNLSTDVCIVGGGIAGLSVAYHLVKEGRNVVILEDGELLSGETGRTTAHLMSAVDDKYFEIENTHGVEYSQLTYQSHNWAVDRIEEIIRSEGIQCDFKRLDGYLFAGPDKDAESLLDKELNAAKRAGFFDVEMVNSVPGRENLGKAIRFPRQGRFDPLLYCRGLTEVIVRSGRGQIYTYTHAQEFNGGKNANVVTAEGFKVSCDNIVVATNSPVNDRLTMITKMEPYRTYVVTGRVKKGSVPDALYWDTQEPYHYVRLTRDPLDPERYDILIAGGEDHKTGQADNYEQKYVKLEKWTRSLFPEMETVQHKWSGQVEEPSDLLAFIGRNPGDASNVFICTGDSGTGMTHTTIAGRLLTDLIQGRSNPWERIYDPSRKPTSQKLDFVKSNINSNIQYKDYLTGGDITDIEDLQPGCGAVIKDGIFHKVAVYRDEKGQVHKCSAVCPHMKAIVHWNPSEKTFDCPAHGSRFDPYGTVINGPSNTNLDKIEDKASQ